MDPFTQRMLERAEQRSKALGITNKPKTPFSDSNSDLSHLSQSSQSLKSQASPPRKTPSPKKQTTYVQSTQCGNDNIKISTSTTPRKRLPQNYSPSSDSKENVDIEINITAGTNVQLQVEVEEREIDEDGNILRTTEKQISEPIPMIRDSSRNRLQRLGALYSDSENLSSPIHRNEARFDENLQQPTPKPEGRNTKRIGKLAALADQINNWEDDSSGQQSDKDKEMKLTSPKRYAPSPPKIVDASAKKVTDESAKGSTHFGTNSKKQTNDNTKQLQWDQNVMDALQQQGFERRQSSQSKLTYNFRKSNDDNREIQIQKGNQQKSPSKGDTKSPSKADGKTGAKTGISKNLVSNRAAMFENSVKKQTNPTKPQKDPAELSIKERLALFEKNKGSALIPKSALGMAPSAKQIMGATGTAVFSKDKSNSQQEKTKTSGYNRPVFAESSASGNCIRSTVAALMSNATTISETQIADDIRKQREQEMNVLLNRFQKSAENGTTAKGQDRIRPTAPPATPPPAPPMPPNLLSSPAQHQHVEAKCFIKRKSNEKMPGDLESDEYDHLLDKRKKSNSSPAKNTAGRLYPVLSDIESQATGSEHENCTTATISEDDYPNRHHDSDKRVLYYDDDEDEDSFMEEADTSDGICDISLGREIMQAVRQNDPMRSATREDPYNHRRHHQHQHRRQYDSTTTSEETSTNDINDDMDEYLDEALEDDFEDDHIGQRKASVCSSSFSYEKNPRRSAQKQQLAISETDEETNMSPKTVTFKSPIKSELTVNPSDDNDLVTLTHTVSFYRRQQSQSVSNTPVRRVLYADGRESEMNDNDEEKATSEDEATSNAEELAVQEKVKRLFDEVDKQHQIMKQTSQALNLCAATFEFSGSTESVEGERHLLVATHRREAAKHEIEKLQQQRCLRLPGAPTDRGRLIVKEITVPLRQDYKEKMDSSTICGHHLVCLLKYNETVLATKTVPTLPGLLAVKFPDILQINNVYADFKITLEIYGMIAQREVLPHDIKYHINKKGGNRTPKGKKGGDSRLVMPLVESAGGPHVVRTPALSRYGAIELTLREIQRTTWQLAQITGVSPLHGAVHMKVNCELSVSIDYKGFLTMFEDVAGFGAWHRRWCRLHGHLLSFWRYPDDEKKKPPMGSIDLRNCCTQKVATAPRDVCARLNTFLVELKRPSQDDDKDSLIIVRQGKYTIVRYLLSADTKQERETWCAYFNKAIAVIRSWQ